MYTSVMFALAHSTQGLLVCGYAPVASNASCSAGDMHSARTTPPQSAMPSIEERMHTQRRPKRHGLEYTLGFPALGHGSLSIASSCDAVCT